MIDDPVTLISIPRPRNLIGCFFFFFFFFLDIEMQMAPSLNTADCQS